MTEQTLAELISGDLPPGIAALAPQVQAELATALMDARWRQADELKGGAFAMLDFLPRFLRGAVKKAAGL
ncbi:hypothetical protein OG874_07865 [Nocardia sp. NBC_00565]|uniref:hypothetical protein n=1 Tax=Nocardia sp. NBC_00565 TaxID=2975993 RepID=UPI002E80EB58|nr:hypothetical protein [Nocardia sp. NBC_00565]WUC05057.1 hypothetical protein OG874_07865 [Nocardia sp. NBC_00565]